MVVLGNPPYSGLSANMGDWIVGLLKGKLPSGEKVPSYYEVDGKPLGEKKVWLQDDYVKFIRFGQWRIQKTGQGVLAFITNHGYLDNPTFRGMRQQLMNTFSEIYVLDLHGSSRKGEQPPDGGTDENVFDIQQGVAIGIFIKEPRKDGPAKVHHAHLWGTRDSKYDWLTEHDISATSWEKLAPASPFYLLAPQDTAFDSEYQNGWKVTEIMPVSTTGIVTARDHLVIDFDEAAISSRIQIFKDSRLDDVAVKDRLSLSENYAWRVSQARKELIAVKDWEHFFSKVLYRPFDIRPIYYHPSVVWQTRPEVMRHMVAGENLGLVVGRAGQVIGPDEWNIVLATRSMSDFNLYRRGGNNLSPLYLYPVLETHGTTKSAEQLDSSPWPKGKDGRRPNLSPDFVKNLEQRIGLTFVADDRGDLAQTFGPEDVFHYIYAVFHSHTYRTRYAEFLKIDFPRVPLTSNVELFRVLAQKGAELVALHLLESPAVRQHITRYPVTGDNLVEPGHPRYLAPGEPEPGTGKPLHQGRVYISKDDLKTGKRGQYIEGVPPEVWAFQVGGYQVCEKWLKDRRGRVLTNADLEHYERVMVALKETIRLMAEVDAAITQRGGWPL